MLKSNGKEQDGQLRVWLGMCGWFSWGRGRPKVTPNLLVNLTACKRKKHFNDLELHSWKRLDKSCRLILNAIRLSWSGDQCLADLTIGWCNTSIRWPCRWIWWNDQCLQSSGWRNYKCHVHKHIGNLLSFTKQLLSRLQKQERCISGDDNWSHSLYRMKTREITMNI